MQKNTSKFRTTPAAAIGMGVVCFVIWLLLSGYFDNVQLLSIGALSCLLVVYIAHRMHLFDVDNPSIGLALRFLVYFPWLMLEIVKANIDVVKRIIDPKLPISPTVFHVKTSQRGDLARVIYANSITLTPGTISLYVEDGKDEIEVHALNREAAESLLQGEMDRRVAWVESGRR